MPDLSGPGVLSGLRVLLTGASSGIGAATAKSLSAAGATVGIIGRRSELLADVLGECQAKSPDCRSWTVDLADLKRAESLVDEAWDAFGGLDVLINNAAVPKVKPADRLSPADVEHAMTVNFFAPVYMTLRVLPRMLEGGGGTIVNVASVGGRLGIPHEGAYCASKFALSGWSESLAIDLHGSNVKICLIHPGPIDTDIWDRPGEEPALFHDSPKVPPSVVAEGIIEALASERFEWYLPDMKPFVDGKNADVDGYVASMGAARQSTIASGGPE